MQKKNYVTLFFSVFFGITLFLLFLLFRPFLSAIAWAIILSTLSYPLYAKLNKWLNTKTETLPAILMTLLILFILILPATFLATTLASEVLSAYRYLDQELLSQDGKGKELFEKAATFFAQYNVDLKKVLTTHLKTISTTIATQTGDILKSFAKNAVNFVLAIFTLFFLFKHGHKALRELKWVVPLSNQQKEQIFKRFQEVLYAIMYGILLTAIIQGTLGGIGFYLGGIPSPVLFGALMMLCALVPVGGTSLIWIPTAITLLVQGHIGRGIFILVWGFLVVGLVDNIMKPIFISERSKLNFILVFFGILGGINLFGLVGVFAGPLIIAIFLALLEIFKLERKQKQTEKKGNIE